VRRRAPGRAGDLPLPVERARAREIYGLELLARRSLSRRLTGWLSATLSRTERELHVVRRDRVETATVPSEGDRLFVLNAIGAYDLGRRWRLGARLVFYTGTPYSSSDGDNPIPPYNDHRSSPFFRVDARVEKRWPLGSQGGSIAFVAEIQNATLSKETYGMNCVSRVRAEPGMAPPPGSITCTPDDFGPITLPSVGVEAFF
jgi:hypothetical protein